MDNLIAIAAAFFYSVTIATIIPGLLSQKGIKTRLVFSFAVAALLCHFWLLGDTTLRGYGQNLSILNVASLVSFMISGIMTFAMFKTRLWFLLPIVYGFTAVNILATLFLPGSFVTHLERHSSLLVHISLALFSYSTLIIAALYAVQINWLDHKLKTKKAMAINPNLPPLLMIERQLFRIIAVGNVLLTGTLLTGFLYVDEMFANGKAHKGVLSSLAWIVFSILLWGHYQQGWRGKRVTWLAILGAALLTLAYFGSRFVREVILS